MIQLVRGFACLLLWTLAACAGGAHRPSGPVDVVEVHRLNVCGTQSTAPQITLLRDVAALQAWQASHTLDFFNRGAGSIAGGAYAVVELGQRNTGGYSVLISRRAKLHDGVLKLTASVLTPQPGQMTTQMITSPCVLVALPPVEVHELLLLDPSGDERAHWPVNVPAARSVPAAVPSAPAAPAVPAASPTMPETPAANPAAPSPPEIPSAPAPPPAAETPPPIVPDEPAVSGTAPR
ncbi:MAG: protease complex subunit PrcB family protein [Nevskia sp.]|nr:protease complex subunit PrcB family protein [Nevskia sp.]